MKVIITEDVINKAINESVNEFMINEKFGDSIKAVGNWAKNAAAMFMDWRTNGQWNRKYGVYANGNTTMGEMYYLDKWFKYYNKKLNDIISNANTPDQRDEYDEFRIDKETGEKIGKYKRYDYVGHQGAIQYALKYCTKDNFNNYIKNISPDREEVAQINNYIVNYITSQAEQNNLNAVLNNLNIYVFYGSKEGKAYFKLNREKQQNQQRNLNNRRNNLPQYIQTVQNWIRNKNNNDNWSSVINTINNNWPPSDFRNWLINVLRKNPNSTPQDMADFLTYDNYMKYYKNF